MRDDGCSKFGKLQRRGNRVFADTNVESWYVQGNSGMLSYWVG